MKKLVKEVKVMANENKSNKEQKLSKRTMWTRIMCLFLAFMMVMGVAWSLIEGLL